MPFTFSHPAIILPGSNVSKRFCSFSALVVGSMTPDFEYFIRMKDYSKYSHSLSGAVWFDIPLGLLLLFIYFNYVNKIFIQFLPFSFNIRFSQYENFNWNNYFKKSSLIIIISLFIGIASHIFWDSFTHDDEYFADNIFFLRDKYNILNHYISGAQIFQYIGSLIGGIIILVFISKMPEGKNTKQKNIVQFWLPVCVIALIILAARLFLDYMLHHQKHEDVIVTAISGMLIGVVFTSLYFRKKSNLFYVNNKINR